MNKILTELDRLENDGIAHFKELKKHNTKQISTDAIMWVRQVRFISATLIGEEKTKAMTDFTGFSDIAAVYATITHIRWLKLAISKGLLESVEYGAFDVVFEKTIDSAKQWLEKGQKEVAAILGRVVIETRLKEVAKLNGIKLPDTAMAGYINNELKKAGIYNEQMHKEIEAKIKLGSIPQHANEEEITFPQVKSMLEWIESNFLTYDFESRSKKL